MKEFKNFNPNLKIPIYSKEVKFAYHLFTININFKNLNKNKDHFMKYLNKKKIFAQYHYIPIYKFSVYEEKLTNMADTEKYFKNTVSIPIFVNLNYQDQKKIIDTIKKYFKLFMKKTM